MKPIVLSLTMFLAVSANAANAPQKRPLPWIGMGVRWQVGTTGETFLYVERVNPDGPAERAGVLPGDIVVKINNASPVFGDILDFLLVINDQRPGEQLRLAIQRAGRPMQKTVVVGTMPESARAAWERGIRIAKQRRDAARVRQ